jgi:hypothetical protein
MPSSQRLPWLPASIAQSKIISAVRKQTRVELMVSMRSALLNKNWLLISSVCEIRQHL